MSGELLALILWVFVSDADVFSVAVFRFVGEFVYLPLCPEDFDCGSYRAYACGTEKYREKNGEEVPQNKNQKAKPDQHHPRNKDTGGDISGSLRYRVCVKTKIHD